MDVLYEKVIERIPVGIGIFEIPGTESFAKESPDDLSVPLRLIDGNPSFYSFFSTKRTEALGKDLKMIVERAFPSRPSSKSFLHTLAVVVNGEGGERIVQAFGATIQILVVPRGLGALLIEGPRSFVIQP